jgi:hypothetical protein
MGFFNKPKGSKSNLVCAKFSQMRVDAKNLFKDGE